MHRYQGHPRGLISGKKNMATMSLLEQPVQDTFLTAPAPPGESPLFILMSLNSKHLERSPSRLDFCHMLPPSWN